MVFCLLWWDEMQWRKTPPPVFPYRAGGCLRTGWPFPALSLFNVAVSARVENLPRSWRCWSRRRAGQFPWPPPSMLLCWLTLARNQRPWGGWSLCCVLWSIVLSVHARPVHKDFRNENPRGKNSCPTSALLPEEEVRPSLYKFSQRTRGWVC